MQKLKVLDLFSGIGGFSKGLEDSGYFETVAFCEKDNFRQSVLRHHWPDTPIYHDIREVSGEEIGHADTMCGGFPCQDVSVAGFRGGIRPSTRSGLWAEFCRILRNVGPGTVVLENVTGLLSLGLGRVLGDLASCGYDAEWFCFPAASVGAPHSRDRVWIVAYAREKGWEGPVVNWQTFPSPSLQEVTKFGNARAICGHEWAKHFPSVSMGNGVPGRLVRDTISACGDSVIPVIPRLIGHAIARAEGLTA